MMTKATRYARTSALPAIAAVLALSSTMAMAQEVQPAPAEPPVTTAPTTDTQSAPAPEIAPDPAPVIDSTDTATPATTASTAPSKPKAKRAAPKQVAAVAVPVRNSAPKTTAAPAAKAAKAAPAAPAAAPPVPTAAVEQAAKPAPAPVARSAGTSNETALEIGGGALALLALGGAAFAVSRRRRRVEEEEWYEDEAMEPAYEEPVAVAAPMATAPAPRHDPVVEEQPAFVSPPDSAFAWGRQTQSDETAEDDGSDRRPGETWIERAHRGPSPANPSVSLKNRLRRAAFFDKRERDVAAGKAEPVETDAGLPEAMIEEQERELA